MYSVYQTDPKPNWATNPLFESKEFSEAKAWADKSNIGRVNISLRVCQLIQENWWVLDEKGNPAEKLLS
jgi:hypothetical protein